MQRALLVLACIALAVVALPPAWYEAFPVVQPELPPAGRLVGVGTGASVNLLEAGAGPPVVLVHGHPGSAYEWQPTLDALVARGRRVLAYDRIGYGRSDARSDSEFTIEANARDLLGVLEANDLRNVTLVGWSYGGGTAIAAARRDASRIGRLVLVGSVGPGIEDRPGPPQWVGELLLFPMIRWAMQVPPLRDRVLGAFIGAAFAPGAPPDDLDLVKANFAQPHTLDTMLSEGRDLDGRAPIDPTPLALPILIVQGAGDVLVPIAVARELDRRAPNSELWIVEGGSHALPVTHPNELADRIVAFATSAPR